MSPHYVEPPRVRADTQRVHECAALTETEASDIAHVIAIARSEARAEALEEAAKECAIIAMKHAAPYEGGDIARKCEKSIRALKETP